MDEQLVSVQGFYHNNKDEALDWLDAAINNQDFEGIGTVWKGAPVVVSGKHRNFQRITRMAAR